MGFHALREEQPDLFARGAAELAAEIERHGGGTPPRFVAPAVDDEEERAEPFSPVRFAEEMRAAERRTGTVAISVVSIQRLGEWAERRGML